jgi:signal transduction histidine kinase
MIVAIPCDGTSAEYRVRCKNNSYLWVSDRGQALRDATGKVLRISGSETDITERKQYEFELREANDQLARATRHKDEFLANMSHELRTPLNAILGMAESLQEEVQGVINDRQRKALEIIERSGTHLLELINDILDLAKIEAGHLDLQFAPIVIDSLCQSSMVFVRQLAYQKNIQLDSNIQSNLPNLIIDDRRIRQALINLLNNAVKFTPAGGRVILEATLVETPDSPVTTSSQISPSVRFSVTDTGIGINPENLSKLFQPFVQIDGALNRQHAGTGLGLSLVKRIIDLHGGRLEVDSEVGIGSCFTFLLPCQSREFDTSRKTPSLGGKEGDCHKSF